MRNHSTFVLTVADAGMLGRDYNHSTEVDTLRDASKIREKLQWVRHHRVGGEMMFHRPDTIKTGRVGNACDVDFLKED